MTKPIFGLLLACLALSACAAQPRQTASAPSSAAHTSYMDDYFFMRWSEFGKPLGTWSNTSRS